MKKTLQVILLVIPFILLSACHTSVHDIVTTLYPQFDFAKNIVGDKMSVRLLLKPGTDSHDFEPTSKDIIEIANAKLFIYTSDVFDSHWIHNLANTNKNTISLQKLSSSPLDSHDHFDEADIYHFWTSPLRAIQSIDSLCNEIAEIDPINSDYYRQNANNYMSKILVEHENFKFISSSFLTKTIYFAGHNALSNFIHLYELEIVSLSHDFKPDAEVTSKQITTLVTDIISHKVTTLYFEELSDIRIARQIANEVKFWNPLLSLKTYELHAYHNITKDNLETGTTYLSLLQQNIANIALSLGGNNND